MVSLVSDKKKIQLKHLSRSSHKHKSILSEKVKTDLKRTHYLVLFNLFELVLNILTALYLKYLFSQLHTAHCSLHTA